MDFCFSWIIFIGEKLASSSKGEVCGDISKWRIDLFFRERF